LPTGALTTRSDWSSGQLTSNLTHIQMVADAVGARLRIESI
jgi:hypothetical protein